MRVRGRRDHRDGAIAEEQDPFESTAESSLRRARRLGQLGLAYQPIISLETGQLAGIEALLRWHIPGAETRVAAEFVDLLDVEGSLSPTDRETLQLAALFRARLWGDRDRDVRVSVNIPARNLLHPQSGPTVLELLERAGLSPGQLELDLIDLDDALAMRLERVSTLALLHEAGVVTSLDGVGRVSEPGVVLAALPIQTVKLDVSGVAAVSDAQVMPDRTLLIRQTRLLGLKLVAKRVEHAHQLRFARRLGFDAVQGYLLGEPLPADGFALLVADARHAPHPVLTDLASVA